MTKLITKPLYVVTWTYQDNTTVDGVFEDEYLAYYYANELNKKIIAEAKGYTPTYLVSKCLLNDINELEAALNKNDND